MEDGEVDEFGRIQRTKQHGKVEEACAAEVKMDGDYGTDGEDSLEEGEIVEDDEGGDARKEEEKEVEEEADGEEEAEGVGEMEKGSLHDWRAQGGVEEGEIEVEEGAMERSFECWHELLLAHSESRATAIYLLVQAQRETASSHTGAVRVQFGGA